MSVINLKGLGLIFDRTQADLDNDTDKAYISYIDLNRIENAIFVIAERTGADVGEKKTWIISEYRTVSEMEKLRQQLIALQNSYYKLPGTPNVPKTITYTSIKQANDIERIIYDVGKMINSVESGKKHLAFKLGTKRLGNSQTGDN